MNAITIKPREITINEIDFYKENGYVVIRNLIPKEVLERVRKGYRKAVNGDYKPEAWAQTWKENNLLQLSSPVDHITELNNHKHIEPIVQSARQLSGSQVDFWYDQLIYKPAGNPWETAWHQDASYWKKSLSPETPSLTAWLAVEDVDLDMGCMSFVPGSHKKGLMEHRDISDNNPINGALEAVSDFSSAVKAPLNAGDVSFHDKYTLHFTSGNFGKRDRCGLVHHMKFFDELIV